MVRAVLTRHSIWETPVSKPVNRDGQWLTDPRVAAFARDSDVRFNLGMVSGQLGRSFLSSSFPVRMFQNIYYGLSLNELSICFAVMLWLFCFSAGRAIFQNRLQFGGSSKLLAAGFAIIAIWFGARYWTERVEVSAVIVEQKAEVRSGPGGQFSVGFTVPEGRAVTLLNASPQSGYLEIGLPDEGLKGWVRESSVTRL